MIRWQGYILQFHLKINLIARTKNVIHSGGPSRSFLPNSEDRSCGDVAVDVGRSVERVESDAEFACLVLWDNDRFIVLLRDQNSTDVRVV